MTKELISELRRRIYDIGTSSATRSDSQWEFLIWRGQAQAYLLILEYLGTVEDEILHPTPLTAEEE